MSISPSLYQNFKLYSPSFSDSEIRSMRQISPYEIEIVTYDDARIIYDDRMSGIYIERDYSKENPRTKEEWEKEFAKRLYHAMRRKGYTQTDLANILDVSPVMVNGWVNGKHIPRLDMVVKIAHILEYPIERLVDFW